MQVAEGGVAPDFSLPSSDGKTVKLSQFKGKKDVVLFFYPASNTPGCTKQACSFSENLAGFSKAGAEGTHTTVVLFLLCIQLARIIGPH
jgi:thioredoxin-dependent peroxiredoxin